MIFHAKTVPNDGRVDQENMSPGDARDKSVTKCKSPIPVLVE